MKKHLKKFFALTMALCLVLSLSVAAFAAFNEATVSGGTAPSAASRMPSAPRVRIYAKALTTTRKLP